MNNTPRPNFAVIYRWRLKPGMETQFIESWSHGTKVLLEHQSFGSRLHKGPDNIWYAYAQWPDAETRERAFALTPDTPEDRKMLEAIEESFPPLILEPVADYLILPE